MTSKYIAIYARYSSDLQKDCSIEDQIALCHHLIKKHNLQGEIITFTDRSFSGAILQNRKGALSMMNEVEEKNISVIVTESLSRLSRDQEEIAGIHKTCIFYETPIITHLEGEVTKFHIGFNGTMNAIYLDHLAEQIRRGQAGMVRTGKTPGSLSYGYKVKDFNDEGKREPGLRAIVEDEANVIRWIYDAFIRGKSCTAIKDELNRRGVPAPRGNDWNLTTIIGHKSRFGTGILRNPIYTGEIIWNRVTSAYHPTKMTRQIRVNDSAEWHHFHDPALRIITDEQWQAAQKIWREKDAAPPKVKHYYPQIGFKMFCTRCGKRFHRNDERYVICSLYKRTKKCDMRYRINISKLMQEMKTTILGQFDDLWEQWQNYRAEENASREAKRSQYFAEHQRKPEIHYLPFMDKVHKAQIFKILCSQSSFTSLIESVAIDRKASGHLEISDIYPDWGEIQKIMI